MEHKIITHIDCPKEWESENDWDSHRPLLFLMLTKNIECHPVCEFGSGHGSTALLRQACETNGIGFQTWENDSDWAKETRSNYTPSYFSIWIPLGYIVFIDGKPGEERKELIEKHKHHYAIMAHDTEDGANYVYGMYDVLNSFKYRLDYKPEGKPATTIVSNICDVTQWISQPSMLLLTPDDQKNTIT